MEENRFVTLYRNWPEEKLLDAFSKRKDYQPEAVIALELVLKERGLAETMDSMKVNEAETAKRLAEEEQKEYEYRTIGTSEAPEEFTKANKQNGIYMESRLLPGQGTGARMISIMLGAMGLCFFFIRLGMRPLFANDIYVFALNGFGFTGLGIYLFRNSKAWFTLQEGSGRKGEMVVSYGTNEFRARAPFRYEVFYDTITYRHGLLKVSHPKLYLRVFNTEGENILLSESLTSLQSPPPGWKRLEQVTPVKAKAAFSEYPLKKFSIIKLKKLLDGLNAESQK